MVAERLATVEHQLNVVGYAKIRLQDLKNPLLTVEKFTSVVENLEPSRYEPLFQELGGGRFKKACGDGKRWQAYIGD
eukprot:2949476-Rhodomonas_salina.1